MTFPYNNHVNHLDFIFKIYTHSYKQTSPLLKNTKIFTIVCKSELPPSSV